MLEIVNLTKRLARMDQKTNEYEKEPTTRERFIPCDKTHPDARHCFKPSKGNSWVDVDIPYLMAFFSVLSAMAAMKISTSLA